MGRLTEEFYNFIKERDRQLHEQRLNPLPPQGATSEKFIALRKQLCCSNSRIGYFLNPRVVYWTVRDWEDGLQPIPHSVITQLLRLNTLFAHEASKIVAKVQQENLTELAFHYYFFDEDLLLFEPATYDTFRGNCDLHYAFHLYLSKALKKIGCELRSELKRSEKTRQIFISAKLGQACSEDTEAFSEEMIQAYRERYRQEHGHDLQELPFTSNPFHACSRPKPPIEKLLPEACRESPPPMPPGRFPCAQQKRIALLYKALKAIPGAFKTVMFLLGTKCYCLDSVEAVKRRMMLRMLRQRDGSMV